MIEGNVFQENSGFDEILRIFNTAEDFEYIYYENIETSIAIRNNLFEENNVRGGGVLYISYMANIEISDDNKILSNNDESGLNAKTVS